MQRNVLLSLEFPTFEVVNWKALVLEELGMKIAWEWFMYVAQDVLQAKPMTYAREMFCYSLKFPKFEVVNWKALVLEELGMKIAWEWFRYVAQVYYKRNQWQYAKEMFCYSLKFSKYEVVNWKALVLAGTG